MENSGQKFFEPFAALVTVGHRDVEDRHDVVLYRHAAKDRHFLWQVANAKFGAAIHRQAGHLAAFDFHMAAFGIDETRDSIECGCLARPVGPKQRHNLALAQLQRDIADDHALVVAFAQVFDRQGRCFRGRYAGSAWPSLVPAFGLQDGFHAARDTRSACPGVDKHPVASQGIDALDQQHVAFHFNKTGVDIVVRLSGLCGSRDH